LFINLVDINYRVYCNSVATLISTSLNMTLFFVFKLGVMPLLELFLVAQPSRTCSGSPNICCYY